MDPLNDFITSLIRTWVPVWVASGLALLAAKTGIVLGEDTSTPLTIAAVGAIITVWYALARAIESRWPGLGGILVTLGLAKRPPTYEK